MRALLAITLATAGCFGSKHVDLPPSSPYARSSLTAYDAALRHYVVLRDSLALDRIQAAGPKDRLVRLLNRGLYLHRLGRYEESNLALRDADALAEERYTKSIRQNLAALLLNDKAIDYSPPAHERAMIHYYGMLNYLALGNLDDALVEARRANSFLDRYDRDNGGRRSYSNDACVQWIAGLLHWSGGDLNAAFVSLQQADRAFRDFEEHYGILTPEAFVRDLVRVARLQGADDVAQRALDEFGLADEPAPTGDGRATGELVVIVENGFVAHRREEKLFIPIDAYERDLLEDGGIDQVLEATARVLVRTVGHMNQASREGRDFFRRAEGIVLAASVLGDAELITLAWPAYERDAHAVRDAVVEIEGGDAVHAAVVNDVSAIAARDFEEQRPKVLARMVGRALFKELAVQGAEKAGKDQAGDVGGFLAKTGARTAAVLTERADTRSWSLLPDELRVARFTLPAGRHTVSLRVWDGRGGDRVVTLEPVQILPGRVAIRSVFVTGRYGGDAERLQRVRRWVTYEVPEAW